MMKGPPQYNAQVTMHVWIDVIAQPPRALLRIEDNKQRQASETVFDVAGLLAKFSTKLNLGEIKVSQDGSIESVIDL